MWLAIDQGTTGTRAALVDSSLEIRSSAYAAHAQHAPQPGWVEHDASEIWAWTQRVVHDALVGHGRPDGVAIANQGETVLVWDARTGEPLHRALVWQDTRTEPDLARYAAHDARIRDLTGLRLDAYFSATKLRWLLDRVPAGADVRAGTLDTWLVWQLTAGEVFATDASTAARTLLCETRGCTWSEELLAAFGIARAILPEIRDSDGGFGVCRGGPLDGVPILASVVDQPAAMMGQGCVDRGDVKATFGTGCFVYANAGTSRPEARGGTLATVAWRRRGETTYALDGGVLAVGSAIDWLRGLGLRTDDGDLAADPGGVACVPALVGLGAPHWDRASRGAWLGMSAATAPQHLVGALAEGLACRVVEVVRAIERDAGVTVATLRADGGLARSQPLMQRVADLLGVPVAIAAEEEATAVGACALAALAAGDLSLSDLRARRGKSRMEVTPRISADERGERLARFDRALALVREWR